MKIAVLGAGAVGSYFGAKLGRAGFDVTFISRGETLKALSEKGLKVKSFQGDFELAQVKATGNPEEIGPVDLLLFCVKSYDTESALQQALPVIGSKTLVLSLQNGVDNPEKIGAAIGHEKVLAAVVSIGAEMESAGVMRHTSMGRIEFGRLDGKLTDEVKSVEGLFRKAEVDVRISENIVKAQWRKLLWNAAFNPVSVLTGATLGQMLECPDARSLLQQMMTEGLAVAEKLGIAMEPDFIEKNMKLHPTLKEFKTSMLQDYLKGKKIELEAIAGIIPGRGRGLGVATPCSTTVYALLKLKVKEC